jgi:hypothetical protein
MPALFLLCLPAVTAAQVIDDFEDGAFSLGGTVFDSSVQTGLPANHCITPERVDRMFINGSPSGANLNLVSVDDEVAMVWGNLGGRIEFDYDPPPTNLTFTGFANAMTVYLTTAVAAGRLEIKLIDAANSESVVNKQITGPGAYYFPHTEFVGVDVTDIEFIQLSLDVPDFGDYHISDFRASHVAASAAGADVLVGQIEGPPYPTGALQIAMSGMDASGQSVPTEIIALSLQAVTNNGAPPATEMMAMDSGGGVGMPGRQAVISIADLPSAKLPHYRTMDLRFDVLPAGELTPMVAMIPRLSFPPDEVAPQSFGIQFTTHSMDSDGAPQFRTDHWIGFEVPEGSGLSFSNIQIPPLPPGKTSFCVFYDVDSDGFSAGSMKQGTELVLMQLNASSTNYGSFTGVGNWTGNESLALWAQPSVMDVSTQLWLSRAVDRDVRLRLYDLAGRAVRTVTVSAGSEFTVWDGRDSRGASVASGMYMLRALDGVRSDAAKIVKLR